MRVLPGPVSEGQLGNFETRVVGEADGRGDQWCNGCRDLEVVEENSCRNSPSDRPQACEEDLACTEGPIIDCQDRTIGRADLNRVADRLNRNAPPREGSAPGGNGQQRSDPT